MLYFSYILFALVAVNFLALLVCTTLRFRMVLLAHLFQKNNTLKANPTLFSKNFTSTLEEENTENKSEKQPFVSIHLPTHSEPPQIVLRTLKSLISLSYSDYEVIVFDNNTHERELWLPLKEFCENQNEKFKFVHAMGVKNYKAGALNLAYQYIDERTTHIMVIDADYCLNKNVLEKALSYFEDEKIGLVQFPQSYYNTSIQNAPLKAEYQHFFDVYMQGANQIDCVLCTGTMSMFRRECLEDIGLWSGKNITEDVEMGIKLHKNNYTAIYVNEALGKGLMPTDLKRLKTQRKRWVYGNMQTIFTLFKNAKNFSFSQLTGIFTILSAWFSFLFVPIMILFLSSFLYSFLPSLLLVVEASLFSIGIEFLLKIVFLSFSCTCAENIAEKMACFGVHFGMSWETSLAWWLCIFGLPLGFERTNKFFKKDSHSQLFPTFILLALLGGVFLVFILNKLYVLAALTGLIILPFGSAFYLFEILNYTQKYTAKLLPTPKVI